MIKLENNEVPNTLATIKFLLKHRNKLISEAETYPVIIEWLRFRRIFRSGFEFDNILRELGVALLALKEVRHEVLK